MFVLLARQESEVLESAKAEPENLVLQHAANSILQERAAAKLAQQQQESSKDNKRGSEKRRQSGDDLQTVSRNLFQLTFFVVSFCFAYAIT